LLGWGYEHITFVDNGRVSYSNPVRQCLFQFSDSQGEDNYKAPIAAKRLKEVYPMVKSEGHRLAIPMPGHAVADNEEQKAALFKSMYELEELVKDHDIIFLLLDSREARWLPTVLSVVHRKVCITIALGFDTFLVMRHGSAPEMYPADGSAGERLGCYFCNDIVAPRNST
jgi:ubiquitin-like modifier-activating enzyme ATG7